MRVPLLNFEGGPEVPLLNFEGVSGPESQGPEVLGLEVLVPLLHHASNNDLIISMRKLINLCLKFSYMTSFKHSL